MLQRQTTPEEYQGLRKAFLALGRDVARASKGRIGMGARVSEDEHEALVQLSRFFPK